MTHLWDAIVIGGGPAGSAAAIRLAQAGRSVLLLEKTLSAHHKVCGEFISIEARHYLEALGLNLSALGAASIGYIRLVKGQDEVCAALPFEGLSLSRRMLDESLLARATAAGAVLQRGNRVNYLRHLDKRWHISTSANEHYIADNVFLATGKHDLCGFKRQDGIQNDYIGFKLHYVLHPGQSAGLATHSEVMLFDGGYAGLEMIEDGRANLCLIISRMRFHALGKNWLALLSWLMDATPLLSARLKEASPCQQQPLAMYKIPYGFIHRSAPDALPGLYRIGDQMAVIPSFCGDGIAIAMRTAWLATDYYLQADARAYYRHAFALLRPQIRRASLLSRVLAFPMAQSGLIAFCRMAPGLLPAIANRTRLADFRYG